MIKILTENGRVRYGTVRYATVRYGTVRYGVVDKIGLPAVYRNEEPAFSFSGGRGQFSNANIFVLD